MRSWTRQAVASVNEKSERRKFRFSVKWRHKESQKFRDRFILLTEDEEFCEFVNKCYEDFGNTIPSWRQMRHNFGKPLLQSWGYNLTDCLALLNTGHMFVLSSAQARLLLGLQENETLDNLLDIGSGDGEVSKYVVPLCKSALFTESNQHMITTLVSKGFNAVHCSSLKQVEITSSAPYNLITCFNVLDRCDKPFSLLKEIHSLLTPDGILMISVVYPFHPFVEEGGLKKRPAEELKVDNCCWESAVIHLVNQVFAKAGFDLIKFARVPYLSEGDFNRPIYSLDSAVYVLKKRNDLLQSAV